MKPVVVAEVPTVGDVVTGQIETAQSSVSNLKIYYVNGVPTSAGFVGLIFLREERGGGRGMRRTQVKLGDIVRAKVVSTMNAMIHLSIGEPHLGVMATLCSNCGSPLSRGRGGHGATTAGMRRTGSSPTTSADNLFNRRRGRDSG